MCEYISTILLVLQDIYANLDSYTFTFFEPIVKARLQSITNNADYTALFSHFYFVTYHFNIFTAIIFHIYDIIAFVLLIGFCFSSISPNYFKNIVSSYTNYFTPYLHLDDVEEEVGSVEDATHYLVLFIVIVLWFYFFTVFARFFIIKNQMFIFGFFIFVLLTGFLVPSALFLQMGIQCPQFIRGSAKRSNFFVETTLDAISVSVIIIRFFVQNIRFVFIMLAFFELYEYILDTHVTTGQVWNSRITWGEFTSYVSTYGISFGVCLKLITSWGLYLYYLGHLTGVFMIQLSVYFVLSFWLYFFLYTSFFFNFDEKYFFYKRVLGF